MKPGVMVEIFWAQVDRAQEIGGCWIWTGATSKPTPTAGEYGKYGGRGVAHRVAYELIVGPIPEGLELDHLCSNTLCCNPDHLEPVSREENMRRRFARITHCKRGHRLVGNNVKAGTKQCRVCSRARRNATYWNKVRPTLDVERLDRECRNGHPRTDETTYVTPQGARQCRTCRRDQQQRGRVA